MNFQRFAELHGLIIDHLVLDKWTRVPTADHPHKRNGAYIYSGQSGAIQNWAMHDKPIPWRSEEPFVPDPQWKAKKEKASKDRIERQKKASSKAGWIMHQAKKSVHPYLAKKGFAEQKTWVWNDLMVVPMRLNAELVGCQLIDMMGNKKFLTGQITKGASAVIDAKGQHLLCEGYATALSVRRVMQHLGKRYTIHIAFSAGNMVEIAKDLDCFVIADNDDTGLRVASKIGKPYWVSDVSGEDFNDAEQRLGTDALSLMLLARLNAV
jgi:putative DNA primase/helicase